MGVRSPSVYEVDRNGTVFPIHTDDIRPAQNFRQDQFDMLDQEEND